MSRPRSEPGYTKRLIQPLEAYILLPDRLCTFNADGAQYTPCMTDLIIHTTESSPWLSDTQLIPVHWLNLRLEPQKMISVVAAVIPMLSYRFKWPETDCTLFQLHSHNISQNRSLVETLPGVEDWNFDRLVNLQVVVVVHWPDPCSEIFEKSYLPLPNAYTIRKALRNQKSITLGVPSYVRDTHFVDLRSICVPGKRIILQADRFALSTAELALALLTALSRGVFKDCNAVYSHWLNALVKSDETILPVLEAEQKTPMGPTEVLENIDFKEGTRNTLECSNDGVLEQSRLQILRGLSRRTKTLSPTFASLMLGPPTGSLKQSRLGLVGLSSELPLRIAHLAHSAIGMEVAYYQKHPVPNVPYIHYECLKDLLKTSDVIILADDSVNQNIPTNPKSQFSRYCALKHRRRPQLWLSFEHFTCLPVHSILICVTSIQCIDFAALNLALRFGLLCGAGLTMPLVWFCNLTEFEALRQLPNTFILPPATSSVCAHSEVRIQIAQEILEVITHILSEPNQVTVDQNDSTRLDLELHVCNGMVRSERIYPPRDLSTTCNSEIISFPRTRRSWPNRMRNLSNPYNHNSTTVSWDGSLTETTTKMSKKWIWITDRFTSIWKRLSRLVTS